MIRREKLRIVTASLVIASAGLVLTSCTRSDNGAPVRWGYDQFEQPAPQTQKAEKTLVKRAQTASVSPTSKQQDDQSVRVAEGDTVYSIARANSLDVNELIDRNDLTPPYAIRPGQKLSLRGVDKVNYAVAQKSAPTPPGVREHIVAKNDTLYSLSKEYGLSVKEIREVNNLSEKDAIRPGQVLAMNDTRTGQSALAAPQSKPAAAGLRSKQTEAWQSDLAAGPMPKPAEKSAPVQTASLRESLPTEGAGSFIWPVKGRVISDYGQKPNGLFNDGVNIAVQPGTPVRASKSGMVTYAGNELKGYGNLLLIKHKDGHVTAYAHNSRLLVRPGDKVQQGDVVAESGSTGAVTSPQLHFEIRRGRKSINPGFLFAAN